MGLKEYWNAKVMYNIVGKRKRNAPIQTLLITPFDLLKFIIRLIFFRPDMVMVNPSMAPRAIQRDFTYLRIAKFFGFPVSVMFHGFHTESVKDMIPEIVRQLNRSAVVLVLAQQFESILREWGVSAPIELVTTKVDDQLLNGFAIENRQGKVENILFLARVTKEKGIFVALDVFKALSQEYPSLHYTVVGDGADWEEAKKYAKNLSIPNLTFTGLLSGPELVEQYKEGDLYLFTSYHEGMPTSVLEAMAFGLPVVTRPVGGLVDFFDDKMGAMIDSYDAKDFTPAIVSMIENSRSTRNISIYNYHYAHDHFLASQVAKRMEQIIEHYIKRS